MTIDTFNLKGGETAFFYHTYNNSSHNSSERKQDAIFHFNTLFKQVQLGIFILINLSEITRGLAFGDAWSKWFIFSLASMGGGKVLGSGVEV